jgi:hypothetical protein
MTDNVCVFVCSGVGVIEQLITLIKQMLIVLGGVILGCVNILDYVFFITLFISNQNHSDSIS